MKNVLLLINFKRLLILFLLVLSTACQKIVTNPQSELNVTPVQIQIHDQTQTPTNKPSEIPVETENPLLIDDGTWWFSELIPESIKTELIKNYPMMKERNKNLSAYWVTQNKNSENLPIIYEEMYILTVPISSLKQGIEWEVLKDCWEVGCSKTNQILWLNDLDLPTLEIIFGSKNESNLTIATEIPDGCSENNCLRIQNFKNIEPGWRSLAN